MKINVESSLRKIPHIKTDAKAVFDAAIAGDKTGKKKLSNSQDKYLVRHLQIFCYVLPAQLIILFMV